MEILQKRGAKVSYNDPFVPALEEGGLNLQSVPLKDIFAWDCMVIATGHSTHDYKHILEQAQLVVDTLHLTAISATRSERPPPARSLRTLVTGAAGFIGYHLCHHLLALGHEVVGADNFNDIVESLARILERPAVPNLQWDGQRPDPATSWVPYRIHNIGNHQPVPLLRFIEILEDALGKTARKEFLPMQPGDVEATFADIDSLVQAVDFRPQTPIEVGLHRFVDWFLEYHRDELETSG